jgi:chitodextrinase
MSKTGSEQRSNEGSSGQPGQPTLRQVMFGSRRHRAAAAGFWVLSLAAAAAISLIPGATAAGDPPLFSDGFESGNLSHWSVASGMTDQQQVRHDGSWAARATSTGSPAYAYKNLGATLSEVYYDGDFQAISQGSANVSIVRFRTATNNLIFSIFRNGNGKLSYYNSITGASKTGPPVSTGSWHDLEVHAVISGNSSLVEVWLDGTKVITKNAEALGTTGVGRFYIGDNTTGHTFDYAFDDQVVSAPDSTPPSTPTGLAVTAATLGSISLRWNASTDNVGVLGYDLFLNGSRIGTTPNINYAFTGLSCGTSYALGVDAYDAAGNTSSQATAIASTASCNGQPPPDDQPPTTPTGLNVAGATTTAISVGWTASTDNIGVAGYDLFRNNSRIGSTAGASYTFSGLTCGTSYTLGVDAYDAAGNVSGRASITAATSSCGGGGYLKTLDSTDSHPVGLSDDSNSCTLARTELGDTFSILPLSTRCTWTNALFSHMHRHEVFEVSERFDLYSHVTDWTNNILIRPSGSFGNANCSSGGNSQVMLVTVRIKDDDHYWLELRGGPSLQPADQDAYYTAVDMGPVVQGRTDTFKFDIVSDYQHGAATVWHNGAVVYNNRDRPLGFHYDCDRTTDISNFDLRMQHGIYRGWSGPLALTSSGFGFLVSDPE